MIQNQKKIKWAVKSFKNHVPNPLINQIINLIIFKINNNLINLKFTNFN